jgi:hypothetical protein
MRHGESRASALWGKGEGRWRRAIVCLTAVAALCAPASALAQPKAPAPTVAVTAEVVAPTVVSADVAIAPAVDTSTVYDWLANWTW